MRTERSVAPAVVAPKAVSKTLVKLRVTATERAMTLGATSSGGGAPAESRAITSSCCCVHRQAEQAQHVPSDAREEQQAKRSSTCIRSTSYQSVQTAQEGAIGPC